MAIKVAKYSNTKNDRYTTNDEIEKLIQQAKRYTDSETGKYDYYSDVDVADFPLFTHRYTDNSADQVKSWRDIYYPRNKLYYIKVKNLPKRLQEKLLKQKVSDVGTNTRSDISPETTLIYDSTGRNLSYTELKYIQQNFPDYAKDYVSIEDKDAVSDFIDQYDPRDILYENVQKANKQRYQTSYERYFNQQPQKGNKQLTSTPRAVPSFEAQNADVVESGSDKDNFFINVGTSENAPVLTGTHIGVPKGTEVLSPIVLAGSKINLAPSNFQGVYTDYPYDFDYTNYEFEPIELEPIPTTTFNSLPMNWGFNLNYRDYDWDDDEEKEQTLQIPQQYPDYMKYLIPYMFSDLREKPFKKEDSKEIKVKFMAQGGDTQKPKRKLLDIATMFAQPDLYEGEIEDIDFIKELFEPLGIRHNSIGNVPPEEAHKYTIKRFDDGGALVVDDGNDFIDNQDWDTYAQQKFSEYEDYQIVPDLTEEELNVFDDGGLAIEELALQRATKATAPKANYHQAIDFVYSPVSAMKMAYDKGVSNCTLTASQFYNPKKPIARAKTITTTPHVAGFYEVGENYAIPGSMVIASLPNGNDYGKNSYHTMILNGYADKNYQFPFKGKVYNVKKGDPLVNYSIGKREPENYIKNIPLSAYLDNSDGKTNVRYYRPYNEGLRAKLLPEIIVTPTGNSIAGGGASSTWANGGLINKFEPGGFVYIPDNQQNMVVNPFEFEGIRYGWLPNGGTGEDVYKEHNDRNGVYVRWDNDNNKWAKTTVSRDLGNIKNYFANKHNGLTTYDISKQIIDSQIKQSKPYQRMLAHQSDLITSDRTDLMPYIRDMVRYINDVGYAPADYFMDTKHKQKEHFIKDGWIEGDFKDYGLVQKQAETFNKNAHTTLPVYKKNKDYINKNNLTPIGQINNVAGLFTVQKDWRDAWLGDPDLGLGSYNAGNFPTQIYIDKDNNLYQEAWDLNDYGNLANSGGQTSLISTITNLYDRIGNPTVVTTGIQPIITPIGKNANISDTTDMYPDKYTPLKKIIRTYYNKNKYK